MERKVYKNLYIGQENTDIVVEDGVIASVGRTRETGEDCGGLTARAGLFDTHAHGCIGYDTMEGHLDEMSAVLGARGIASWLPTTMTMPIEEIAAATAVIPETRKGAARVRGFHLEGPYFSEKRKGAQNPAYLRDPSAELLDACPNAALVSIAPELDGSVDFIREAVSRGVRVSVGHTDADYDTVLSAIQAGANCLTHTFNAMPPMLHRAPGPVGAALTGDGYVQVIADGYHLHPAVVLALYRMFGPDRMILISDMIRACGMPDGEYVGGGLPFTVKNGQARLPDGTINGSTTFLDDIVRRAVSFGIPVEDAFRMASATPARFMGMQCGLLAEGYDAEICLWDGLSLVRVL